MENSTLNFNHTTLMENVTDQDSARFPAHMWAVGVVITLIGIACITTNVLTLVIVYRRPILRHKSRQLLISLAVADLLVGVAAVIRAGHLFLTSCQDSPWNLWISIAENIPVHCSVDHMLLIAIDRFLAVLFPFWYEANVSGRRVRIAISVLWLVGIPATTLKTLWFNHSILIFGCGNNSGKLGEFLIVDTVLFNLTLVLLGYMYCRIWCVARQHIKQQNADQQSRSQTLKKNCKMISCKATKTVTAILVTFLISYQPLEMLAWLYLFGAVETGQDTLAHHMLLVSLCLVLCKSCCNFFIYAVANKQFYQAYRSILHCETQKQSKEVRIEVPQYD